VDPVKALSILSTLLPKPKQQPSPFAKEEKPKEEKKEEPKSEPEKKRSGGYVKSADGCAVRGKTKGRMV
jgi:hypothetical protein